MIKKQKQSGNQKLGKTEIAVLKTEPETAVLKPENHVERGSGKKQKLQS